MKGLCVGSRGRCLCLIEKSSVLNVDSRWCLSSSRVSGGVGVVCVGWMVVGL